MRSKQQSPIWPYLGILICLFVLSVTAPRAWERMAREESLTHALAKRDARSSAASHDPEPAPVTQKVFANIEPSEPQPTAVASAPAEETAAAPDFVLQQCDQLDVQRQPTLAMRDPSPAIAVGEQGTTSEQADVPAEAEEALAWPLPRLLIEQLTKMAASDLNRAWPRQAIDLIHEICQSGRTNLPATRQALHTLRALAARNGAVLTADGQVKSRITRAHFSLIRWLDIWDVAAGAENDTVVAQRDSDAAEDFLTCLAEIDRLTAKSKAGAPWRAYLELDELQRLARLSPASADAAGRVLARKTLVRLESPSLSEAQRKFASSGPLAALKSHLRVWTAEPIELAALLANLERYEESGLPSDARLVAQDAMNLSAVSSADGVALFKVLSTHYLNANVRMATSVELLNHMLPKQQAIEAPVRDTVANVPVVGRSTTFTEQQVRLVPDGRRIRAVLEVRGTVDSNTIARSGPVRLHNAGQSVFLVRKQVAVSDQGLVVWPAQAQAESVYNNLLSVQTNFDGMPLFGGMVRSMARNQAQEQAGMARGEVEYKVATRAGAQLDAEVQPHLTKAVDSVKKNQLGTLHRLNMEIAPVSLSSTRERAVGRVRVAAAYQLGGHTPRPQAPSDSWYSLQLHQSALNNVLEQLDLDGREFELGELFTWVGKKLDRPQWANLDDLPDDVKLTFAKKDAVRLRFENNLVEVTFSFAKLSQGRNRWHDFTVRTYYRPEGSENDPRFVREDAIQLDGRSVRGKPVPILRAIFSRVLSRNRDVHMLGESLTSDPRFKNLRIAQFIVDDGWIALAYSPERAPRNLARKPK